MNKLLTIELAITHFTVWVHHPRLLDVTKSLGYDLVSYRIQWDYKSKRLHRVKDKSYYIAYEEDRVFIFPLTLLKVYLSTLGTTYHVEQSDIEFVKPVFNTLPLNVNFISDKQPRDYQQVIIDEICLPSRKINFIDLFVGAGKGLVSIYSLIKLNKKTGIILLPKYIDKWIEELTTLTDVKPERICVIQGSDSLITVMNDIDSYRENKDIFIFSMRTVLMYLDEYINTTISKWSELKYPIDPTQLMQALGIGVLLNDEAHQEFHALYTAMMFFQCEKFIAMSATLYSHDKHKQYLYNILFPKSTYCTNLLGSTDHVDVYGVGYHIEKAKRIPCERKQGYSQVMFEQYMLSNTYLLQQYLAMILEYADRYFIKRRDPGDRMVVFCSTIDMCKYMATQFARAYSNLTVSTYVQDDDYQVLFENDVIISTLGSAGTGIDLPGLITVLQTISVGSYQANVQAMGRLRKHPSKEVDYVYFYCKNLPKHYELNKQREESLRDKVKSYTYLGYTPTLRK